MPFGGLLGSTFNFVFENQLEALQNGDRFYYLSRTAGLQLRHRAREQLVRQAGDAQHRRDASAGRHLLDADLHPRGRSDASSSPASAPTAAPIPTGGIRSRINGVEITPLVIRDNPARRARHQLSAVHRRGPRRARRHRRQRHPHLRRSATTPSMATAATTASKAATATTTCSAAPATTSSPTWAATTSFRAAPATTSSVDSHSTAAARTRQHHPRRRRQGLHHHLGGHLDDLRRHGRRLHLRRQDEPAGDRQRRRRLDRAGHPGRRARRQLQPVPGRRRARQRHLRRRRRLRRDDRRRRRRHLRRQRRPGQDGRHVRLRLGHLQERHDSASRVDLAMLGGTASRRPHRRSRPRPPRSSIASPRWKACPASKFTDILRGDEVDAVDDPTFTARRPARSTLAGISR